MLDKIRQIKYNRMKPEERWIYNILTNLEEYYHPKYSNNRYYKHKDILLFNHNQNSGHFWCHYSNFWSVLEWKFSLTNDEIRVLIKRMVEEYIIKKDIQELNSDRPNDSILDNLGYKGGLIKNELVRNFVAYLDEDKLVKKDLIVENVTGYGPDWKDGKLIKKDFYVDSSDAIFDSELDRNKELIAAYVTEFRGKKGLIKKGVIPQEDRQGVLLTAESDLVKKEVIVKSVPGFDPTHTKFLLKK